MEVCDGTQHCGGGEDEWGCLTTREGQLFIGWAIIACFPFRESNCQKLLEMADFVRYINCHVVLNSIFLT